MCVVSMVGDHYRDVFKPVLPKKWEYAGALNLSHVTRAEFDELKRQVEEMKALLVRAKEYDERNGEPECEVEEKMVLLRKIAEAVGVNLDDVIGAAR